MQASQAGVTALITAYARAYHATHDSPKIFDDFLADQLYTPEEHAHFDLQLAQLARQRNSDLVTANADQAPALAWSMQVMNGPVTLSRSSYSEDALVAAVKDGVRQYVNLGAGFDTFAFRRQDLLDHLTVFEIDHPTTQAMKRARIALAGWEIPPQLHLIPVDFTTESLTDVLGRSAYNRKQVSFFSWLGVTYYLTREVVLATLKAIAGIAPQGSSIVFDYMDADSFVPDRAAKRTQLMHNIARQVGEPMQTGFDPLTLADDLAHVGFTLTENLSPADIETRYFAGRTDQYHAFEHVHFAKAIVT